MEDGIRSSILDPPSSIRFILHPSSFILLSPCHPVTLSPCHILLAFLAFLAAGCDGKQPKLTPVRGTVYYRGVPLTTGTIVFTPDPERGGRGPLAQAEIKPDGSYILQTDNSLGAVPGWHLPTVSALQPAAPPASGQGFSVPLNLIPPKYSQPGSCPPQEVKAGQENTINISLE